MSGRRIMEKVFTNTNKQIIIDVYQKIFIKNIFEEHRNIIELIEGKKNTCYQSCTICI